MVTSVLFIEMIRPLAGVPRKGDTWSAICAEAEAAIALRPSRQDRIVVFMDRFLVLYHSLTH